MKNFLPKPSWADFEQKWLNNYEDANYGKSMSGTVLSRTHRLIEDDERLKKSYDTVLELGVGNMAHFKHVTHDYKEYIASDHDPKVMDFLNSQEWPRNVKPQLLQGAKLPFEDESIDRVIATHVLEHILEPESVLKEWVRVIKPGGVLSLILPCDPGFLWQLGRNFGPRRKGIEAGLPYDYYMAVEHRNSIQNLEKIIDFHFPEKRVKYWPFRLKSSNLNLIYAVNCYV